jgi:hypothetical protein
MDAHDLLALPMRAELIDSIGVIACAPRDVAEAGYAYNLDT